MENRWLCYCEARAEVGVANTSSEEEARRQAARYLGKLLEEERLGNDGRVECECECIAGRC